MLELTTEKKKYIYQISLSGILNSSTQADFKVFCEDILRKDYRFLILDIHELEYISSQGITALIYIGKRLREKSLTGIIASGNKETASLLEFLGIDSLFIICREYDQVYKIIGDKNISGEESSAATDAPETPAIEKIQVREHTEHTEKTEALVKEQLHEEIIPDAIILDAGLSKIAQAGLYSDVLKTEPSSPKAIPVEGTSGNEGELPDEFLAEHTGEFLFQTHAEAEPTSEPFAPSVAEPKAAAGKKPQDFYIKCGNCGIFLKIVRPGKHCCPDCRKEFLVDINKTCSFI